LNNKDDDVVLYESWTRSLFWGGSCSRVNKFFLAAYHRSRVKDEITKHGVLRSLEGE
jgi:hypothetical protein